MTVAVGGLLAIFPMNGIGCRLYDEIQYHGHHSSLLIVVYTGAQL
jgi:hypothetical protein